MIFTVIVAGSVFLSYLISLIISIAAFVGWSKSGKKSGIIIFFVVHIVVIIILSLCPLILGWIMGV